MGMRPTLSFPAGLTSWKVTLTLPDGQKDLIRIVAGSWTEAVQGGIEILQRRVAQQPERYVRAFPTQEEVEEFSCPSPPLL